MHSRLQPLSTHSLHAALNAIFCDGWIDMTCPSGTIGIVSAVWGRTVRNTVCVGSGFGSAMTTSCRQDVTPQVTALCGGNSHCVESGVGHAWSQLVPADPCFGTWKYINVTYACTTSLQAGGYDNRVCLVFHSIFDELERNCACAIDVWLGQPAWDRATLLLPMKFRSSLESFVVAPTSMVDNTKNHDA